MKKISGKKIGDFFTKTGNYIKDNPKPLLYIGGAIAVVVIGATIVKRFQKSIKGESVKGGKWESQSINTSKTTISQEVARNYAEQLFNAFNYKFGSPPLGVHGTDKSVIENVFSKINSEDFKMIYNAFGTRSYGTFGSPDRLERFFNTFKNLDLVSWLNEELGFGDSALKNKIRPIIEGAGFVLEN